MFLCTSADFEELKEEAKRQAGGPMHHCSPVQLEVASVSKADSECSEPTKTSIVLFRQEEDEIQFKNSRSI